MSQSDDRFYKSLASSSIWSFDYKLFKAGESTPIASSDFSYFLNRSNTLRIELEAGDYIVHVRQILLLSAKDSLTLTLIYACRYDSTEIPTLRR